MVTKHGHRPTGKPPSPTYRSWHSMKQRATNKNGPQAHHYIGRGIGMCPEWADFSVFLRDMGERPPGKSLERIDNSKGYSPCNCRWATQAEQMRNRRTNVFLTVGSTRLTVKEWSEKTGVPFTTLRTRMKAGWPPEKVITTQRFATNQFT